MNAIAWAHASPSMLASAVLPRLATVTGWSDPILFAGLPVILVESVVRRGGRPG